MAMRYTAICEPNTGFRCLLPMLRASDVQEMDAAMREWVDPANNLIMADVEGNIAYLTRGKLPVRSVANAWLPVPGWTGEHEWQGFVPFEELPRALNPGTGYLATANNRIVGNDFPHFIALDYAPPSRAQRILAHLGQMRDATVDDMAAIHADRVSLPSRLFIEHLEGFAPPAGASAAALATLRAWDGRMERESAGAAIYIAMRDQLLRAFMDLPNVSALKTNPFKDEPPLITAGGFMWWVVPGLMGADDTDLLPAGETWPDRVATAFEAAVNLLTRELGDDQSAWAWGKLHRTNPNHPLALAVPELGATLNPPSVPMGGDGDTPQAAGIFPGASFNVAGTSVTRYIFDVADWDNSRWIVPLGASGHPGSLHYADQAERWSNVEYIPMTYSWDKVADEAVARLLIEPEE
jgi:penicillin amidase